MSVSARLSSARGHRVHGAGRADGEFLDTVSLLTLEMRAEYPAMSAPIIRAVLKRSFYRDSVVLMRVAEALRARPGVREAAALMGTPANYELLDAAGLATSDMADATPSDLILAVAAVDADTVSTRARLERLARGRPRWGSTLLGLYTGGTLAYEARLVLEPLIGQISTQFRHAGTGHRIVDLGGDEFTVSRPHPMLDPDFRAACLREAGRSAEVGVVLVDLVLGRGAHENPGQALADAAYEARHVAERDGRTLVVAGSVVGTRGDPQGLLRQAAMLEAAGVELFASNAQAARFAALVLEERRRAWPTS